ncbi:putative ABC transport system permease protein [Maribacter dokdonensis]|uniref:ABC transporter permease n=1 Tax=Maribacter dokdonensis TaxID=320912 RepID=UPI001B2B2065|nr:FtsX-like permease family protein [Maribacter dokdonensis]CAG2532166.1 putative ABC transport system permease protein [Maribacter dokdonensis]
MAWRDGKASGKRLLLFMASIILGIAAVVSIQSFSNNLKNNIGLQSKALMGADFLIDSNQPANERVVELMDSLGGYKAREVKFASMAAFPKSLSTKLVQVRAIEGNYPFYGELETDPKISAFDYQDKGGALVDATVMLQFDLKPGDSVKLGTTTFPILGALITAPGSTGIGATAAPPIVVPFRFMEESGLLQRGSRLGYNYYFEDDKVDLELLNDKVDPLLDAENADMDTHTDTSERLGRRYENVGRFLNLVAFIALLLGCVGIASSVHIYIKEKLKAVAVLKCLGATRKQTFLIFLLQIAGMGLLGGIIGTAIGLLLQQTFPLILQEFLPFTVEISTSYPAIFVGLLLGVSMSVLFALSPLVHTWFVSPLQVLRVQEDTGKKSRPYQIWVVVAIVLFVLLFALWLLGRWEFALSFVVGILVTFSILAGVSIGFMRLIKKYFPKSWSFAARQSLLNLYRPNNQTVVLILAIGIGTFLISTLYFTKDFLLAKTTFEASAESPNLILFDVQTEQRNDVENTITPKGLPVIDNIPIVTMRMERIKDRDVNDIRLDTTTRVNKWILNHEFRTTYRDSMIGSEKLLEGEWLPSVPPNTEVIPISLADNVANDALVKLGDTLLFNVQGKMMTTVVGNIRQVDWARMQLNFSIVFPTGVLEKAPQFHVVTTNAPDKASSANLQRELVKKFPNISIIDLRQVVTLVENILDKISWVITFMAFFSILTGIIVLIGSVRNSKYQRIRESVLLRTLGAQSKQILKINALEYLFLGVLGSGVGVLLSLLSSFLLAYFIFDTPFIPSWVPFLVVLPGITLLVLAIGLFNSRGVLNSPPLQVLRKEG